MPLDNPTPGLMSTAEFMVSTLPWLTSSVFSTSIVRHDFPFVTQFVCVKNTTSSSSGMTLAFTQRGLSTGNCMPIEPSGSFSADYRVTSVFLSGALGASYALAAGLTGIPSRQWNNQLTASNGFAGVG
jgi:hypothetical protein